MDVGRGALWEWARAAPRAAMRGHTFRSFVGKLQRHLCVGEPPLFKHIPKFKSDFIQISKRKVIVVHTMCTLSLWVGIACTSPDLTVLVMLLRGRLSAVQWCQS